MTTKNTSIRFDNVLYERIVEQAKLANQSISAYVEQGMTSYINEHQLRQDNKATIDDVVERFTPLLEKLKDR